MNKLINCGCGGKPTVFLYKTLSGHKDYLVICTKCGICIPPKPTEAEAIMIWNRAMRRTKVYILSNISGDEMPFCPHCGDELEWE